MLKLACVVLLAVAAAGAPVELADTELVMTFLVHRHGDRTPIPPTTLLSSNPEELEKRSAVYGPGQLTIAGKRRAYKLGQSLRERYNDFVPAQYNHSEIYIRSTDSTRAKMTVLSALAALFPPQADNWSDEIAWTPVPYTTLPPLYDFNLANSNCPAYTNGSLELMSTSTKLDDKYDDVLELLTRVSGFDVIQTPVLVSGLYDVYSSQKSLGIPVDPEIEAAWDDFKGAAGEVIDLMWGNENYIALQAGPFLNEFYTTSADIISGASTQRFRIYAAHDFNVYSLEAVTKVNRQGTPEYASAYVLELRKVVATGKYVVAPVYLPSPGEEFIALEVEGCGSVCDYDDFVAITSEYALDVDIWRTKCGWTPDLVIDDSSFA